MSGQMFVGDVGTLIRFIFKDQDDVIVDISAATTLQGRFRKPDGTVVNKTLSLVTDGTDGAAQYEVETGFLDVSGLWDRLGLATLSGDTWKAGDSAGNPLRFTVNLGF